MKNFLLFWSIFFSAVVSSIAVAAEKNSGVLAEGWCASGAPDIIWEDQFQQLMQSRQTANGRIGNTSYTIPIIVHVIYYSNVTSQNITQAQVNSQIPILNNDFAGIGFNSGNVPSVWAPLKANTNITFCAAKLAPNNTVLAEPGIERISAQSRGWTNPGTQGWTAEYINTVIKPATSWDPNLYLNVWVVPRISGSVLGYAQFPGLTGLDGMPSGSANGPTDGVVIRAASYGNVGSAAGTFGRTTTHEIGHWLGLRHIWGDNGRCNGSDFCDDTPKHQGGTSSPAGANYGCPTFPLYANQCESNPNGDMFMNFMDYTNDNCMYMFTNDQSDRMQTTMQFGQFRTSIASSPVCDTVKQPPYVRFIGTLQNSALCATSKSYNFTDRSLFAPTSWSWTFEGGTPATSTQQNPTNIVFNTPGIHNVTLVATNIKGSRQLTIQVNVPIAGNGAFPLLETFEAPQFPPQGWDLVNRNGNPNINWDVLEGYSGYGIGNRTMRFDNTTLDARIQRDDIMTYKMNLTGVTQARLKFDLAHAPYYGPIVTGGPDVNLWDTLEVLITDNCQTTTQSLYRKGDSQLATVLPGQGDEFYPAANQWRTDSVNIPANYLNKPNVQIIFRNYGNYGHTIYVDNINVFNPSTATPPSATASFTLSDTTVCSGGSLTFTNTSTASSGLPDSVRWTINGGTPSTSTSATTVSPVFNTPGTYNISLIAYKAGNASTPFVRSVRVKLKPTVTVNSPAICSGNTATLTAGGATTYTWSPNIGTAATVTTPVLNSNASYTVTGTTEGCTGTAVANVTVNTTPTVTVNSPTICSGNTAALTAFGATTYTWSPNIGSGANVTTPVLNSTTTYTVTGTTGTCSKTAVATVTVNATPNVTVNSPTICSGNTAILTAGGATTYTWSPNIGTGATVTTPVLNSATAYTVTGTTGSCSKSAVATVTVNATPTVTVNSVTICSGNTATLTAGGATTYTWSPNIGTGVTVTTPVLLSSTSYTVTGTTSGCTNTAVATVTVNASPNLTVNSPSICSGSSATLTAAGASTYSWSPNIGVGPTVTTPVLTSTTTYTVTGAIGSCTKTAVATVTVNATAPTVSITPASPSVCLGESITLNANGANNYSWSSSQTGTTTGSSLTFTPTGNITVSLSGTVTGCTTAGTTSTTVTVKPKPTVAVNSPAICTGQTASLTATGATTYSWSPNIGSGANVTTPALTGNTTYTVTGTTDGCTNSAVSTVTVNAIPVTILSLTANTVCSGEQVTLNASGAASYSWSPDGTGTSHIIFPTSNVTYTVTGTSNNCSSTASQSITVNAVPSTPSITQSNDTLYSSTIVAGAQYKWYKGGVLQATTTVPFYKITSEGLYTVEVAAGTCTSALSAGFSATLTAIRNASNTISLFELFPNPTDGRLIMNLSLIKNAAVQISIFSPEGREMYVRSFANTRSVNEELNITAYAKGVYIIRLAIGDELFYHKVVRD